MPYGTPPRPRARRVTLSRLTREEQGLIRQALGQREGGAPAALQGKWTRAIDANGKPEALFWCPDCGRTSFIPGERIARTGRVTGGVVLCRWAGCDARYLAFLEAWDPTPPQPQVLPGQEVVQRERTVPQ